MSKKNIFETDAVRDFVAGMSPLSRRISKEELERGIARTQSDMDIAMRDPSLRNDVSAVEARYAALSLLEDYFRTAAGSRKLSAYRDSYHRDFVFTVALDAQDVDPVSCTTRDLAIAYPRI